MGTNSRVSSFVDTINKKIGSKALFKRGETQDITIPRFSSQVLSLDLALGGGWPHGRIVLMTGFESTAKTLLALKATESITNYDHTTKIHRDFVDPKLFEPGVALFVDAEATFDSAWADKVCNFSKHDHVVARPESSEEAIDIISSALEENCFDLIVLDSLAVLTPAKVIESSSQDQFMGLNARMNNRALSVWNSRLGVLSRTRSAPTIIVVNQIRQKIGVMFGCFHADVPVVFWDGSRKTIKEVVDNQLEGPVVSYNPETGVIEPKKIINWYNNGSLSLDEGEKFIQIKTTAPGTKNGCNGFCCTPNHVLFKADGEEIAAGDVRLGEKLMTYVQTGELDDPIQRQIVLGSLLGDGAIGKGTTSHTGCLKLANSEQQAYLEWKVSKLPSFRMRNCSRGARVLYSSRRLPALSECLEMFYSKTSYRSIPKGLALTPLMAAVWYMDDGFLHHAGAAKICATRLKETAERQAALALLEGLHPDLKGQVSAQGKNKFCAYISVKAARTFFAIIAPFIIPEMQYKLPEEFRGLYDDSLVQPKDAPPRLEKASCEVIEIAACGKRRYRNKHKYDLQIEQNSSYAVGGMNGVIVHNSNETLPGGLQQLYAASIILRQGTSKIESGDIRENSIGTYRGTISKNKTYPAKNTYTFQMYIAEDEKPAGHVDNLSEVRKQAKRFNLLQSGKGGWSFTDENGTVEAKRQSDLLEMLESDPKVFQRLYRSIVLNETGYHDGKVQLLGSGQEEEAEDFETEE